MGKYCFLLKQKKNDLGKNARSTRAVNQYSSHNRWIGRLTAIVFVIVIGMTGLWWWQSYQQNTQERDDLVQSYVASTENNQPATALVTTEETNKTVPETAAPVSQPVEITKNLLPEIAQENSVSQSKTMKNQFQTFKVRSKIQVFLQRYL